MIFRVVWLNGWGGRIYWQTWLKGGFRINFTAAAYTQCPHVLEAIKT